MKLAALLLGLIGGIAGLFGALLATGFGAVGGGTTGNGIAALIFSLLGIVAASLAMAKPKVSGILMLLSAVGGLIAVSAGYIVAFPLLLIAGIFALRAAKKQAPAS